MDYSSVVDKGTIKKIIIFTDESKFRSFFFFYRSLSLYRVSSNSDMYLYLRPLYRLAIHFDVSHLSEWFSRSKSFHRRTI